MRDWTKPLRKAYYTTLVNQVFIESAPVAVWQEKLPEDEPAGLYIVIGDTLANNESTFDKWGFEVLLNLEVVALGQSEVGDFVDDMVDQVKQLIFLSRTTFGITPPAGFNISRIFIDGENDIPVLQTATGYIKRKILRFHHLIIDNN